MSTFNSFKNTSDTAWINRPINVWSITRFSDYIITASITEPWKTPLIASMSEPYAIMTVALSVFVEESWVFPITKSYLLPYYDALTLNASIVEWYDPSVLLNKRIDQPYDSKRLMMSSVEESYTILGDVQVSIIEGYAIAGTILSKSFEEPYPLKPLNAIQRSVDLPYYILDDASINKEADASLLVGGEEIDLLSISLSASTSAYTISCDITLPTIDEYKKCNYMDDVILTFNADVFHLFIEAKASSIDNKSSNFTIKLLSPTAKLDSPYSDTIVDPLPSGANTQTLIEEMAAIQDITVDYQIFDRDGNILSWDIPGYAIAISDETPLAVIKKIANAVGAIVQTKPNGDMLIISEYPIPATAWESSVPDATFTIENDIIKLTESTDIREGYNAFTVTDQGTSSENISLEEVEIDSTTKQIKGYRVPFGDDPNYNTFELASSGILSIGEIDYDIVTIEKYSDPVPMIMPEGPGYPFEEVEFIDGVGKTQKPIYKVLDSEWSFRNLGSFQISEDGTLTLVDENAEYGESVLRIRYETKYWLWTIRNTVNSKWAIHYPIQVYVPEIEAE